VSFTERYEWALVPLVLLLALAFRVFLLLGPFREIDADEAVVGLMALEMPREMPAFYWEQHYLGTIEPIVAAALFSFAGPSEPLLKLVPALFSVAFIGLVYATARPIFGPTPALLAAVYLAVPPSFFAAWSVKARGGYMEALALGQLFLVASRQLADNVRLTSKQGLAWMALAGLAGGLALWTHPLAVVFLATGALYVLLAWRPWHSSNARPHRLGLALAVAAVAFIVGLAPAIVHNVTTGFPSLVFAAEDGTAPGAIILNGWGLVRYGLPVLVGLAEGTPSRELLLADWPHRLGSSWLVTVGLPVVGLAIVWAYRAALVSLVRGRGGPRVRGPALFVLILFFVPPFVAVSRFANLWAEPRYALPLYAAVPLVTALVWRARRLRQYGRGVAGVLVAGLLGLNLFSLLTSDYRLSLPTSAGESTAANRVVLLRYLGLHGINRIYTDYWLAYPIAFESHERVVPAVWSGGFSRRASYAHLVFIDPNPAFVFARGTAGDAAFQARLGELGGTAHEVDVDVYRVYTNVQPLDAMRSP
jgi:hypothetical protein